MENPESASYEGIIVLVVLAIAFVLTYVTKKQRERKYQRERKKMAKDLAEIKNRLM